jgi:hypothetical protein
VLQHLTTREIMHNLTLQLRHLTAEDFAKFSGGKDIQH